MSYDDERERPGRQPASLLRLHVPFCQLRYGTTNAAGTCPAVLGTDSETKCYNTLATCPVPDSFDPADVITTFCTATQDIPPSEQIQPTVVDIDAAPRRLAPTKGLGESAQARITLINRPWHDVWEDPYRDERAYNPIEQGTYWPKWLARNPYYRGIRAQLLTGYIGEDGFDLNDFEAREYILDNIKGPDRNNQVTLELTDVFRLLEKDRSLYPAPNTGELAAAITTGSTSFTLAPSGIGNAEYPASFRCIIGDEGFDVTRSGDTCSITQRGLYKGLDDHEAEDSVQIVAQFSAQQVNQIAETIITTAQPDLASWIPTSDWQAEADAYLPRLYGGDIVKPTGVNELLAELMESVPVMFWPNPKLQRIEMRAIKGPQPGAKRLTDRDHYYNLEKKDRPQARIDAVLVHFGMLDPTEDRDEATNYAQGVFKVTGTNYKTTQIKEVFSRWIARNNKPAADELAELYKRRYRETPASLKFELDAKHSNIWTGTVFLSDSEKEQDKTGANKPRNYLVIEAHEAEPGHRVEYEAESYDWWIDETDESDTAVVIFSETTYNVNLRAVYDTLYANVRDTVRFEIEDGVILGATDTGDYSVVVGDWPAGTTIVIVRRGTGRVQGAGGRGGQSPGLYNDGSGDNDGSPGEDGGPAFYTRVPVTFEDMAVWGGGGGGGSGGSSFGNWLLPRSTSAGGGGQGAQPGAAGRDPDTPNCHTPGTAGTTESSGQGGDPANCPVSGQPREGGKSGDGGGSGQPGQAGQDCQQGCAYGGVGAAGGAAGTAIDGVSYITFTGTNDIQGPQVN